MGTEGHLTTSLHGLRQDLQGRWTWTISGAKQFCNYRTIIHS